MWTWLINKVWIRNSFKQHNWYYHFESFLSKNVNRSIMWSLSRSGLFQLKRADLRDFWLNSEVQKEAESSDWLHTGIHSYLQSLQMDSLKAQSMCSTKLWRSVIRPRNSDLILHFAVDCCSLYYATKSQNSTNRMKMPSEIIKTNWTLYSIFHVPCFKNGKENSRKIFWMTEPEVNNTICSWV